jgi:oligopeptide transport system permease protein
MIYTGLPVTFELAFYAIIVAMIIGVLAGVIAAVKRNTMLDYIPHDHCNDWYMHANIFVRGLYWFYFLEFNLSSLPVSGWDSLAGDKILPSITLGAAYAAYIARLSRGGNA